MFILGDSEVKRQTSLGSKDGEEQQTECWPQTVYGQDKVYFCDRIIKFIAFDKIVFPNKNCNQLAMIWKTHVVCLLIRMKL